MSMGIEEERARNLALESARSLAVLRRFIPSAPGRIPEWAKGSPPRGLIAALLAGAWDEEIEGDKAALERLAGEKYEALAGELAHLVGVLDKPLRKGRAIIAGVMSLRSAYRMSRSRDWSKTMRPRGQSSYS